MPFPEIALDIGSFPQWIVAIVAALGLWKSWVTSRDMKQVKRETNGMRAALESAKHAEGVLEGRKERNEELGEEKQS